MASEEDAQASIARAVESARYNEAVVVTVDLTDGASREIVLVACLDSENGGVVWRDAAPTVAAAASGAGFRASDDDAARSGGRVGRTFDEDVGVVRHLRTKRWALPMLNDRRRNRMYDAAVRRACRRVVARRTGERSAGGGGKVKSNNTNDHKGNTNNGNSKEGEDGDTDTKGDKFDRTMRILDIGAGTGLLAMMAARHALDAIPGTSLGASAEASVGNDGSADNKPEVRVTSVEMASAMARLARLSVGENSLSENIAVVERHSTDGEFVLDDARFGRTDSKLDAESSCVGDAVDGNGSGKTGYRFEKADVCTSELLESGLLGEGVLPSLRDAWKRHLKPDAIVVPRCARVLAMLVEGLPLAKHDANAAASFLGPDLSSFREASGGVWMSTSPPSASDEGALLGSRHSDNGKGGEVGEAGGVIIPLHADAMLDEHCHGNAGDETIPQQTYDGFGDVRRSLRPLSDPRVVLDFNFASGLGALPSLKGRSVTTNVVPMSDGVCHGVLFWWELDLWDGDDEDDADAADGDEGCTYSTEPIGFVKQLKMKEGKGKEAKEAHWQDHWQQCLFLFGDGCHRSSSPRLTKGSPVKMVVSHDDTSISFSLEPNSLLAASDMGGNGEQSCEDKGSRPFQRRKLNEDDDTDVQHQQATMHRHITPARALQLNDLSRIRTLRAAIHRCIEVKGRNAPLLDLSDMGLCAMIAAVSEGAAKVTSLESSPGSTPTLAATIAQMGNDLPRAGAGFQIVQALAEHLQVEHITGGAAAEIVVAEPYYQMLEGWHLQEAVNYFYLVRSLKSRGVISPSALSVPAHANVVACILEFDQFSSAYGRVGDRPSNNGGDELVAGFFHAAVNHYGDRYHTHDVSLPLWQYRCKRLTDEFRVARISYEGVNPAIEADEDGSSVAFVSSGLAHCVAFWVEYACRTRGAATGRETLSVVSTASSSHRQLVRKLRKPIVVTDADVTGGSKFCCKARFGDDPNGIEDHSFAFELSRQEDGMK